MSRTTGQACRTLGTMTTTPEQVALVALLRSLPRGERWSTVTERVLECGSAEVVWKEQEADALVPDPALGAAWDAAEQDLADWHQAGWRFLMILDEEYPARLRDIHQAPPFLFAAGHVVPDDPAIAVVGSRKASPQGLRISGDVATALASEGITVLSGLAEGIDAAAHTAALEAGGRTVALIGSGIARYYPAKNRELQDEIAAKGLVLSQFWPDGPPQQHNFLMRNAVMSGYGRATVVVEAGEKSGARAQARMAVEHGRPVILTNRVIASNEWAQRLIQRPGVYSASSLEQVMDHVHRVLERDTKVDRVLAGLRGSGL